MTKKNVLLGIVLLLLIANSVVLYMLWHKSSKREGMDGRRPAEFLIKETGMDSGQQAQYMLLVDEHQKATRRLKDDLRKVKTEYFDLLSHPNDSLKTQLEARSALINRQLDEITFQHFLKVRNICREEQKAKFDKTISEVIHMMSGPPGRPPHERPHPMHMPPPPDESENPEP